MAKVWDRRGASRPAAAVHSVIESRDWKIAEQKERLAKRPNRLKVHGLLVHGEKPRLTKNYRHKIRTFKHLLGNERVATEDVAKLQGHISYASSVDNLS